MNQQTGTVFQIERWDDALAELVPLFSRHWHEVYEGQNASPFNVDSARYSALDAAGILHLVVARRDGKIIGYHIGLISNHLHSADLLHAVSDCYWFDPEVRHGIITKRLFEFVENDLARRGVVRLYTSTPLNIDQGGLFERLGFEAVERVYVKKLEAK